MPTQADLIALAKQAALAANIDPALVCAVVEQESGWNPWASRYEDGFLNKYLSDRKRDTETMARATSYGLMQVMGETARELGFDTVSMTVLCDPATSLKWGCQLLKKKLTGAKGDTLKALSAYNGGSNKSYATQVMARMGKYVSAS